MDREEVKRLSREAGRATCAREFWNMKISPTVCIARSFPSDDALPIDWEKIHEIIQHFGEMQGQLLHMGMVATDEGSFNEGFDEEMEKCVLFLRSVKDHFESVVPEASYPTSLLMTFQTGENEDLKERLRQSQPSGTRSGRFIMLVVQMGATSESGFLLWPNTAAGYMCPSIVYRDRRFDLLLLLSKGRGGVTRQIIREESIDYKTVEIHLPNREAGARDIDSSEYDVNENIIAASQIMDVINADPSLPHSRDHAIAGQTCSIGSWPAKNPWSGHVWLNVPANTTPEMMTQQLTDEYPGAVVGEALIMTREGRGPIWFKIISKSAANVCRFRIPSFQGQDPMNFEVPLLQSVRTQP